MPFEQRASLSLLGAALALSSVACEDDESTTPLPGDEPMGVQDDDGAMDAPDDPAPGDGDDGMMPGDPPSDTEMPASLSLVDDSATTALGVAVIVDVIANDEAGGAEVTSATDPENGSVVLQEGKVVYTPDDGFSGEDTFEYVVDGDDLEATTAAVTVTVLSQPGTVVLGQLYTVEIDENISWAGINAAGDRVGEYEQGDDAGSLVLVPSEGDPVTIDAPGPSIDQLARGIADDGTVLAQYLHETRYQFIGFTWNDGVHDRICDVGDGLGDCTPEAMTADGTIVGTTYDYVLYSGFVWPSDGERQAISLDGYASTYAYDMASDGTIVGIGDNSDDGFSGPSRCFAGPSDSLSAMTFTDGDPHFVYCRATNDSGLIVGGVKPMADGEGIPRSMSDRIRAAIWHPEDGLAYVPFPVERPSEDAWRVELLLDINDAGVMVGYLIDATLIPASGDEEERTERVTRGITLTPVQAQAGTAFVDSSFDHVNGPI